MTRTLASTLLTTLLACAAFAAHAQDDEKKMRPVCKMGDSDVHLAPGGWAGPKCITADAAGDPVPEALAAEKDRVAKVNKDASKDAKSASDKAKPLCAMGDPGVVLSPRGTYTGPKCNEADTLGRPVN